MKQLFLFFIFITVLASCGLDATKKKITYDIIYTDGTHERVSLEDNLRFAESGDCVVTCGCDGIDFKRCGVRKFDRVYVQSVAVPPLAVKNEKPKPLIVKAPVKLKN